MANSEVRFLVRELQSLECSICGSPKEREKTFCPKCFKSLPAGMQRALYTKLWDGYGIHRDKAAAWLRRGRGGKHMIKFVAPTMQGGKLLGLGLSEENIKRLKDGQPIHFYSENLPLGTVNEVLIFYGETEEAMEKDLRPFIGKDTNIIKGMAKH